MENNRRSFFKGLAAFASGVVAAKVASYTPKKQEEMMVSNNITITHDGKEYHPVVVAKTEADKTEIIEKVDQFGYMKFYKSAPKDQVRKLNI
jgi:hypothetical protein